MIGKDEIGSVNLYVTGTKCLVVPKIPPHGLTTYHTGNAFEICDVLQVGLAGLEASIHRMLMMSIGSNSAKLIPFNPIEAKKAFDVLLETFSNVIVVSVPKLEKSLEMFLVLSKGDEVTFFPTKRGKGKFNFSSDPSRAVVAKLTDSPTFSGKFTEAMTGLC